MLVPNNYTVYITAYLTKANNIKESYTTIITNPLINTGVNKNYIL